MSLTTESPPTGRRLFFKELALRGLAGAAGLRAIMSARAWAMGRMDYPQGMREIKGRVMINDTPAQVGGMVAAGDVVATGPPESLAVFVVGEDAYLMRENSRLIIPAAAGTPGAGTGEILRLVQGKMLAVFGKKEREIRTETAVIGIRGSGLYIEEEPGRTYVCTCYGRFRIASIADPGQVEEVRSRHHENPRYVLSANTSGERIIRGPMKNHTDAELILLESLLGRIPPFARKTRSDRDADQGGGNGGY